jgi:predicted NUDIX family NTP pyrophosphohydrolase
MIAHPRSCGILLYRRSAGAIEVWLGHMGGPLWARKDAAAWSIPKGEPNPDETDLAAAHREFREEIGAPAPNERYEHLGDYRYASGKVVTVFAAESAASVQFVGSNDFEMEWPPRSGRTQRFPEIDRAEWVPLDDALEKLVKGQRPMLADLITLREL